MTNNNPLVSIVVPVYNVEKYLDKCIVSLREQTYSNIEIILVNDGSPDGCAKIIARHAEQDQRIKIVNKPNGGLASARNAGVAVTAGEWVWNIDSDDYVELDSVENVINLASQNDSDIFITGHYKLTDNSQDKIAVSPRFLGVISGEEALIRMLNHRIGGDVWCKFYKRELYTKSGITQNEAYSVIEDVLINYQIFSVAKRVTAAPFHCLNHIYRAGSYSSTATTHKFLRLHHLGAVSMKEHGFITPAVEKAYNSFVFNDFLGIYAMRNKTLLKETNLYSVNALYNMLKSLKNSDLTAHGGGVRPFSAPITQQRRYYTLRSGLPVKAKSKWVC